MKNPALQSRSQGVCGVPFFRLSSRCPNLHEITRRYHLYFASRIRCQEFIPWFRLGFGIHLAFVSLHHTVRHFDEIQFMRRTSGRSPEIELCEILACVMQLHAFHEEVLPQRPGIISRRHGREISDNGVSNAVVAEINFFALLQFVAQITRERTAHLDNEALLKERDVVHDGRLIESCIASQPFITHFRPHVKGQKPHQAFKLRVVANAGERKEILEENPVHIVLQRIRASSGDVTMLGYSP